MLVEEKAMDQNRNRQKAKLIKILTGSLPDVLVAWSSFKQFTNQG